MMDRTILKSVIADNQLEVPQYKVILVPPLMQNGII